MHNFTNVSHWVCIGTGVLLVVTGILSHARQVTTNPITGRNYSPGAGLGKRLVLIGIGLFAVVYGMARVLS